MHTSQCGIYSTHTYHCLQIGRSKVEDSRNLEKVIGKNDIFEKAENHRKNEQNSNWPVGHCSGPLVDIFGSTEPWTHALSKRCQREILNLNGLGSKIEIYAQNSAFLRKNSPHINQKISEPKQPTDDRTTCPKSPWMVLSTYKERKKSIGPMPHSCANPGKMRSNDKSDCGRTGSRIKAPAIWPCCLLWWVSQLHLVCSLFNQPIKRRGRG